MGGDTSGVTSVKDGEEEDGGKLTGRRGSGSSATSSGLVIRSVRNKGNGNWEKRRSGGSWKGRKGVERKQGDVKSADGLHGKLNTVSPSSSSSASKIVTPEKEGKKEMRVGNVTATTETKKPLSVMARAALYEAAVASQEEEDSNAGVAKEQEGDNCREESRVEELPAVMESLTISTTDTERRNGVVSSYRASGNDSQNVQVETSTRRAPKSHTASSSSAPRSGVVVDDPPLEHSLPQMPVENESSEPGFAPDPPLEPTPPFMEPTPAAMVSEVGENAPAAVVHQPGLPDPPADYFAHEMDNGEGSDDEEGGRAESSLGDTYEPPSEIAEQDIQAPLVEPASFTFGGNHVNHLSDDSLPRSPLQRLRLTSARGPPSCDSFGGSITHSHLESFDNGMAMNRGLPIHFGRESDDKSFPAMPNVGLNRERKSHRSISSPDFTQAEAAVKKSSPRHVLQPDSKKAYIADREAVEKAWEGIEYQLQGSYANAVGFKHSSRAGSLWRPLTHHSALKHMLCFGMNRQKDDARRARHSSRKIRGPFLETKVQGSQEKVIDKVSKFAREENFEVWRSGTDSKLRCKFNGNTTSIMWMAVEVDPLPDGCSTIRVRRARADRGKTDWWRFAMFHRDVIARFEEEAIGYP